MSDSLDAGIGHSDPGSIDGHVFGLEKQPQNGGATAGTTSKKHAKATKNQRQSSQPSNAAAVEEKPKYSWSEHVWSK